MEITASKLRADIYRIIDRVIRTGEPVEIRRKNDSVLIVPVKGHSKLDRLSRKNEYIKGDPEELVHMDWSGEWTP